MLRVFQLPGRLIDVVKNPVGASPEPPPPDYLLLLLIYSGDHPTGFVGFVGFSIELVKEIGKLGVLLFLFGECTLSLLLISWGCIISIYCDFLEPKMIFFCDFCSQAAG